MEDMFHGQFPLLVQILHDMVLLVLISRARLTVDQEAIGPIGDHPKSCWWTTLVIGDSSVEAPNGPLKGQSSCCWWKELLA
jgi:hypothetical protein